jgi:hypothetical protein
MTTFLVLLATAGMAFNSVFLRSVWFVVSHLALYFPHSKITIFRLRRRGMCMHIVGGETTTIERVDAAPP